MSFATQRAAQLLSRRTQPDPERPFINRDEELNYIDRKLKQRFKDERRMEQVITCFWGTHGLGKSWLLLKLRDQCKYTATNPLEESPTLTALVDLDHRASPFLWSKGQLNQTAVIRHLWEQLAQQVGTQEDVAADEGAVSTLTLNERFVRQVTQWSASRYTPILLLDTVEAVMRDDPEGFQWLERSVIEPLAMTDRVLFVLASRGAIRRFESFQVRRRLHLYEVKALAQDRVAQQIVELEDSQPVQAFLYRHAFGHPLATEFLGTRLEQRLVDEGLEGERLSQDEINHLLSDEDVLNVLCDVRAEILSRAPERIGEVARHACVLRWLNVGPLRRFIQDLKLMPADRTSETDILELINELQTNYLIYWNVEKRSYEFQPALRKLLAHVLELEFRQRFVAAHQVALDYHQRQLDEFPEGLSRHVPEVAYHAVMLYQARPTLTDKNPFYAWWRAFVERGKPRAEDLWEELEEQIDADEELRERYDEADSWSALIQAIQTGADLVLQAQERDQAASKVVVSARQEEGDVTLDATRTHAPGDGGRRSAG